MIQTVVSAMAASSVIRIIAIILITEFPRCCRAGSEPTMGIKSLSKRSALTFPPDSLLQVNMGITLAGHLKRNNAVVVLAFQQNAPLPKEAQPLVSPSLVVTGRQFSIYDNLKAVISSYGFNGLECLKKMICQVGETPLLGGLVEDVITFVLSPSKHRSIQFGSIESEAGRRDVEMLLESELLGVRGGNCTSAFPQCIRTPLDMISTFI